jgi:ABC-type amino acid transport substrate-binding protein
LTHLAIQSHRRLGFWPQKSVLTNNLALGREIGSIVYVYMVKQYIAVEDFPNELHIATNLTTDKKTVKLLGEALKSIKRSGRYQQIIDKWGL